MRLRDYICDNSDGKTKSTVEAIIGWLEEQARLNRHDVDAAVRVTAGCMATAANELRDQLITAWQ